MRYVLLVAGVLVLLLFGSDVWAFVQSWQGGL